jgi:hypothetical protein
MAVSSLNQADKKNIWKRSGHRIQGQSRNRALYLSSLQYFLSGKRDFKLKSTGSSNLNQQSSRRRASDTSRTLLCLIKFRLGKYIAGIRGVDTSKAKEIAEKLLALHHDRDSTLKSQTKV